MSLLPTCTAPLLSRLLDAFRSSLPRFPDAPALTALLLQLTYCATSFARLGFDFRMLLPPLFEDAVRTRVSAEFSKVVDEFARTPETARAVVGAPRGGTETTASVLHIPPQGLVVDLPIAMLATSRESRHETGCGCWSRRRCWANLRVRSMPRYSRHFVCCSRCSMLFGKHEVLQLRLGVLVPFVRKGLNEGSGRASQRGVTGGPNGLIGPR